MAIGVWRKLRLKVSDQTQRVALGWTRNDGRFQVMATLNGSRFYGKWTFDYVLNMFYDLLEMTTGMPMELRDFSGYPERLNTSMTRIQYDVVAATYDDVSGNGFVRPKWAEQFVTFVDFTWEGVPAGGDVKLSSLMNYTTTNIQATFAGCEMFTDDEYDSVVSAMMNILRIAAGDTVPLAIKIAPEIIDTEV